MQWDIDRIAAEEAIEVVVVIVAEEEEVIRISVMTKTMTTEPQDRTLAVEVEIETNIVDADVHTADRHQGPALDPVTVAADLVIEVTLKVVPAHETRNNSLPLVVP